MGRENFPLLSLLSNDARVAISDAKKSPRATKITFFPPCSMDITEREREDRVMASTSELFRVVLLRARRRRRAIKC